MKAVVYTQYGPPDVLRTAGVEKPAPGEKEILVRVRATSVNYGDLLARRFGLVSPGEFNMAAPFWLLARLSFGWSRPRQRILGNEYAGEVVAAGPAVTRFKVGDAVYGYTGSAMRAYAEYICVAEDREVTHKPANLSFEQAAVIPYGAITAYNLLKHARLHPARKLLIIGASGSIGAAAVQLAKMQGAEVTGVCSTPRVSYVQSLGADRVIDYTQQDFREGNARYDSVLDVLGRTPLAGFKKVLTPEGQYLVVSFKGRHLLKMFKTGLVGRQKLRCIMTPEKTRDLATIRELVEAGQLKAVVDKTFALDQAAEAHRYAEAGNRKGGIAIQVGD